MKCSLRQILAHPSMGRPTIQVPEIDVDVDNDMRAVAYHYTDPDNPIRDPNQLVEYPDDFFMRVKTNRLTSGKESGFLYLSPKGWEHFKAEIKKAFEDSDNPRGTWDEFENKVQELFAEIRKVSQKREQRLRQQADELSQKLSQI